MTVKQCEQMIHKYRTRLQTLSNREIYMLPGSHEWNNIQREIRLANRLLAEYQARLRKLTS